jgi:hypothetical protein
MHWLNQQGRHDTLSKYQKEKLKVLEVYKCQQPTEVMWNQMYERMMSFHEANEHFAVSKSEDPK